MRSTRLPGKKFTWDSTNPNVTWIEWGWDGLFDHVEMLQIQVDRSQGWTDLAYDSTPDSTDTAPHPTALTTWKYRAIWRTDEAQIGIWSPEVSIVGGGGS